ncbi:endonuclease/exonuclease protein-like protein [Leptomonas seymouri]|uniref:Endonuclease/exonuclease protein-like protein n=1 Tax=Leptomonas seymouri TaxID=5684 RepID=A0A0N1PB73_LEPSE|nr:endonuclease/exonuclease protein-like protein [Leptomonas seymouri]|eukprot:KPI84835.1 endonuclease/exonuclease protein-like protein [Leptomonas seymouri]
MFIISWNVAGWSSTSQAIRESYGSLHDFFACTSADIICLQECKGTLAKLNASPVDMGASDPPVNRRPAVCPLARLTTHTDQQRVASPTSSKKALGGGGGVNDGIEGWESFWSFSGKQHRGFNGVVTFARKGLTWRCDNQPFVEEEFNEEGRVVVTYHSAFVLVNVYVPNARGGARHTYKFNFLRALEKTMEKLRCETKKPVMLVGDLNMTYRAFDGAWSLRRIHLGTLLQLEDFAAEKADAEWVAALPHLPKAALQRVINMIANSLCARVLDLTGVSGEARDAPREASSVPPPSYSPESTPALSTPSVVSVDAELVVEGDVINKAALQRLGAALRRDGATGSGGSGVRMTQMYEAPPLPLRVLHEVGFRCVYASDFVKSFSCAHNNELYAVVRYCGLSPHSDASADFMSRLLHLPLLRSSASVLANRLPWDAPASPHGPGSRPGITDYSQTRMFDSFLLTDDILCIHSSNCSDGSGNDTALDVALMEEVEQPQLQPYCPCPYTVWDQSRNRRLENVGTRLDYIIVDAALLPAVECRREGANNVFPSTESTRASRTEFFSEVQGSQFRDGMQRAMAGGAYPPAPFDGSGMPALAERARELCCAGLPATGLFVTPPQFSDHIGVGLVLNLGRLGGCGELLQRPARLTEDHKCMYRPPVGLHTFFAAAAAKKSSMTDVTVTAPTAPRASETGQKRSADKDIKGKLDTSSSSTPQESAKPLKAARTETKATPWPTTAAMEAEVVDVDEL